MSNAVRSASVLVALVLSLALPHKLTLLRRDTAQRHPLLMNHNRLRPYASFLVGVALTAELTTSVLLLVDPIAGLPIASGLLFFYASQLKRLPPSEDCECFGQYFPSTARAGGIRNVVLGGAAAGCWLLLVTRVVPEAPLTALGAAPAGVMLAGVLAAWMARRAGGLQTFDRVPTRPM